MDILIAIGVLAWAVVSLVAVVGWTLLIVKRARPNRPVRCDRSKGQGGLQPRQTCNAMSD